ncbi:MAG: hypothetical protein KGI59_01305 [Patescibacteria group bacterium]|nr:hypothetical protein [Patescibacteria group bacterium]
MPFFSKGLSPRLTLILDVQSSVVRGSLVAFTKNAVPEVISTAEASIAWKPRGDSAFLIKVTLKAVEQVVGTIMSSHHELAHEKNSVLPRTIDSLHFALSSPWIVSQAKVFKTSFAKETPASRSDIERAMAEERARLIPVDQQTEVTVIEEKIFDVRLNGYSVADWMGKPARNLEASYAMSIAGTRMIERFRQACGQTVPANRMSFHSSLLLQFIGMRTVMPERASYGLFHVHGELTDIAIMNRGGCTFFGSMPEGVRTVVRKVANRSGSDDLTADSLLTLYAAGHIDEIHSKKDRELASEIAEDWSRDASRLASASTMPAIIYMSASAHDDYFSEALAKSYTQARVVRLSIDDLVPHVRFAPRARRQRLPALYAIAIRSLSVI